MTGVTNTNPPIASGLSVIIVEVNTGSRQKSVPQSDSGLLIRTLPGILRWLLVL